MKPVTIASCLQRAPQLAAVSDSPRLDLELLLCEVLQQSRTWLFTWSDKELTPAQTEHFHRLMARRLAGEPIAHILGQREFWSLPLMVDNSTLIPRPDTERLVELALELFATDQPGQPRRVLDLGTGTGAIALALASEKPAWELLAVDQSPAAIALATRNRDHLQLPQVCVRQSNWFSQLAEVEPFDLIVTNPPYIDPQDPHLQQGDLRFEPHSALVAERQGLADIDHICTHARDFLRPHGWLLLEHGYDQGAAVRQLLQAQGFTRVRTLRDYGGNERVSAGQAAERDSHKAVHL